MTSSFSNSPPPPNAVGDTWTNPKTDVTYEWDGQRWIALDSHVHTETYVNRSGDTMQGPLISAGSPRYPAEVTNKDYVDDEVDKLKVEIAAIAIEKGSARNYQLTDIGFVAPSAPGQFTLDTTLPGEVESISMHLNDIGGAASRIPNIQDIIELDRNKNGQSQRFVVIKQPIINGASIDIEVLGSNGNVDKFEIGDFYTIYVYPQNSDGVTNEELLTGLDLKVDRNGDEMTGGINFKLNSDHGNAMNFSNDLIANSVAEIVVNRPYPVDDGPNVDGASRTGKGGLDIKLNSSSDQNRIRFWGGSGANKEILDITAVNNGKGIKLYHSLGLLANNNTDQTIWARSGNRGHLNYRGTASTDQRLSWGESKVWISNAELDMQSNKIINVPNPTNDSDAVNYRTLKTEVQIHKAVAGPGVCQWIYRNVQKTRVMSGEFCLDSGDNFWCHKVSANGIKFEKDDYVTSYTIFPHFVIWRLDNSTGEWSMVVSGDIESQGWYTSDGEDRFQFRTRSTINYTPANDGELCCLIVEQHFG